MEGGKKSLVLYTSFVRQHNLTKFSILKREHIVYKRRIIRSGNTQVQSKNKEPEIGIAYQKENRYVIK
jgi:hypothetical protein